MKIKFELIEDCTSIQEEEMNMFPWLQIIAEITWEEIVAGYCRLKNGNSWKVRGIIFDSSLWRFGNVFFIIVNDSLGTILWRLKLI